MNPRPASPAVAPLLVALAALALAPAPARALIPRVSACAPPGWAAPVVPRADDDVTDTLDVQVSAQLPTGEPTWFCWASCGNASAGGGWTDALYVDGTMVSLVGRAYQPDGPGHQFFSLNDGPVWVRGGRHAVAMHADLFGQLISGPSDDDDDYVTRFYLWPPMAATWGTGQGGPSPPSRAPVESWAGPTSTCEARALQRPALVPWVIAATGPGHPGLFLYDDYVNSTTGLSHELGRAFPNGDSLEFLVGLGEADAATVYPAIMRDDANTPGDYVLSSADATDHAGGADSEWPSVNLPAQSVAQVFRVTLAAGQTVPIQLTRFMGTADLAFAVFAPGTGGAFTRRDAIAYSAPRQSEEYDVLAFDPPMSGDYPLVVYRTTRTGIDQASGYALALGSQTTGVGSAAGAPLALAVASAQPAEGAVRLVFDLPDAGRARLGVFDAQGRRVRSLADGALAPGRHEVEWDARDDAGSRLGAGVFWVRLEYAGRTLARRVIRLR
jgi:hypothetical protein